MCTHIFGHALDVRYQRHCPHVSLEGADFADNPRRPCDLEPLRHSASLVKYGGWLASRCEWRGFQPCRRRMEVGHAERLLSLSWDERKAEQERGPRTAVGRHRDGGEQTRYVKQLAS
jgi:hypothetical protein